MFEVRLPEKQQFKQKQFRLFNPFPHKTIFAFIWIHDATFKLLTEFLSSSPSSRTVSILEERVASLSFNYWSSILILNILEEK